MHPPKAPQRPHVHREHGIERLDPWFWLRDKADPETLAYIEAENAYTQAMTAHQEPLRKQLYAEMLGRIQETDESARICRGPWAYSTRTVEGLAYPIHCRRPAAGGDEQVVLDENELARGFEFFHTGTVSVSPDHARLAVTVDTTGDEIYDLVVLDIATGEVIDRLSGISGGVTWCNDSASLLWRELDSTQRAWRVHVRRLGNEGFDPVIFEETDPRFRVGCARTRPGKWMVVYASHHEGTEMWLLDGDDPTGPMRCVQRRADGLIYDVEVAHDRLWILSTDGDVPGRKAVTYRLYSAPLTARSREAWTLELEARPDVALEEVAAFRGFLVRAERVDGVVRFIVRDLSTGAEHAVAMHDTSYVAHLGHSPEYEVAAFHYTYSSLTTPSSTYRYDIASESSELLKQTPVPGFDPSRYRSARVAATAADGTSIPISLVWRGDEATLPTDRACLLYGYGSYGITIEPQFSSIRPSLLDRGVVFAIAHVRGGGFLGRGWYEAAKFHTKERTFDDFVAAGRHLQAIGLTRPERMAIMGGSAGGMLVGAVLNRAPDLCRCALAMVPFVDIVTTMLDASLPLTAGEWVEWGDPREADAFRTMLAYSPYDNVHAGPYPDLLVTSGLNDPRVQYWEPTKWVAKLRDRATIGQLLLHTHMGAGHQGKSGRYGYLEDIALEYAWLLDRLGIVAG